jgi:hypothetical protein
MFSTAAPVTNHETNVSAIPIRGHGNPEPILSRSACEKHDGEGCHRDDGREPEIRFTRSPGEPLGSGFAASDGLAALIHCRFTGVLEQVGAGGVDDGGAVCGPDGQVVQDCGN